MSYIKNLRKLLVNNSASGNVTLIPGGQLGAGIGSIRVWQVELEGAGAVVLTPYSGPVANNNSAGAPIVFTGAGATATLPNTETPWMDTRAGESLIVNFSTGAAVTGTLWYSLA